MQDEGLKVNFHYKQIGYVNGLDYFRNILHEKIMECQEQVKQQRDEHQPNESPP